MARANPIPVPGRRRHRRPPTGDPLNTTQRGYRLDSIDLLRGAAIVLMAIDHARDFMMVGGIQDPMTDPDVAPALFLTRWITHFCAPVFVLLAGTSAGLMAARKPAGELAGFLAKRGLWLILVECLVISTAWTFAPGGMAQFGGRYTVALGVIWVIGFSMVVLAAAQFLGRRACFWLGAAIILGHNALDGWLPASNLADTTRPVWMALHTQMAWQGDGVFVRFVYPLLPWPGVMMLGYGLAALFERPPAERNGLLRRAGLAMIAGFVALRASHLYGDPNPWQFQPGGAVATFIDFMNCTKYPPSLLYLLMTLGPAAVVCSYADRFRGWLADTLVMFGRVPFMFYVAHLYLLHGLALVLGVAQGFQAAQFLTPFRLFPEGYGVPLPGVYLAWLLVIALLYPACRWMAGVKARRRDWWLSYL